MKSYQYVLAAVSLAVIGFGSLQCLHRRTEVAFKSHFENPQMLTVRVNPQSGGTAMTIRGVIGSDVRSITLTEATLNGQKPREALPATMPIASLSVIPKVLTVSMQQRRSITFTYPGQKVPAKSNLSVKFRIVWNDGTSFNIDKQVDLGQSYELACRF